MGGCAAQGLPMVGARILHPDHREGQPKGYTRHEVTAVRAGHFSLALRRQACDHDAPTKLFFDELKLAGFGVADVVADQRTGDEVEIRTGDGHPVGFVLLVYAGCAVAGKLLALETLRVDEEDAFELAGLVGEPVDETAAVEDVEARQGVDLDDGTGVVGGQGESGEEDLPLGDVLQQEAVAEAAQEAAVGVIAIAADDAAGEPALRRAEGPEDGDKAGLLEGARR